LSTIALSRRRMAAEGGGRAVTGSGGGLSSGESVDGSIGTAVNSLNVISMGCQSSKVMGGIIGQFFSEVGGQTAKEKG
jgi:hypothetical protein